MRTERVETTLDRRAIEFIPDEMLAPNDDAWIARSEHMRTFLKRYGAAFLGGTAEVRIPQRRPEAVPEGRGHFHLAPELFLQVDGVAHFAFPGEELTLEPGQALVVPPRVLHFETIRDDDDAHPFANIVVYPNDTELTSHLSHEAPVDDSGQGLRRTECEYLEALDDPTVRSLHDWLVDAAKAGIEAATASDEDDKTLAEAQMRGLLAAVCAGVIRLLDRRKAGGHTELPLVSMVRAWVQNQLGDCELSVARLADQAGCSSGYLSRAFVSATGERLTGYISRQRMKRATQLLSEGDLSGKEVAWACGFANHSYFSQVFRHYHGCSPSSWCSRRT
jgi:AraC-like DNA-binding protein